MLSLHVAAVLTFILTAQTPLTVYVGPQTRGGFVDADRGVLDSIKDVAKELRKNRQMRVVARREEARLVLEIVGRRAGSGAGGVGVPIGAMSVFVPVQSRAIDAVLKVGDYEKAWTAEDRENDTWTHAARVLARDVAAWIDANRDILNKGQ